MFYIKFYVKYVCTYVHVNMSNNILTWPPPRCRIDPQPNDWSLDGSRPQPLGIGGHTSGSVQFPVMSCYCMYVHALQRPSVSKLALIKKSLCYPKSQLSWHCPFNHILFSIVNVCRSDHITHYYLCWLFGSHEEGSLNLDRTTGFENPFTLALWDSSNLGPPLRVISNPRGGKSHLKAKTL